MKNLPGLSDSDFGKAGVLLTSLFEDIMSTLGVPTSTILTVVGSLKGKVEKEVWGNEASMDFTYTLSNSACFDNSAVGTPIVFDLVANKADALVTYAYTTTYRYLTMLTYPSSGATSFLYTDSLPITKSVQLQFVVLEDEE